MTLLELEDFRRFFALAEALQKTEALQKEPASLRKVAETLGVSAQTLTDSLNRLEKLYQCPLVRRAAKTERDNKLTDDGEALFKALRSLETFDVVRAIAAGLAHHKPTLRVAMSRSLLSSQLLFPNLAEFIRKHRDDWELALESSETMEFGRGMADVERRALDLLLAFRLPESLTRSSPQANRRLHYDDGFSPEFDVVFVANQAEDIDELDVRPDLSFNEKSLVLKRLATVNAELEPRKIRSLEVGRRITLGNIDAVLTHVRMGLADYGIVPAIYRELDRNRQVGMLFYSNPIAKAKLVIVTRQEDTKSLATSPPPIRAFVQMIRDAFKPPTPDDLAARYLNLPAWGDSVTSSVFPVNPLFYAGLNFGYYVDHDRDESNKAKPNSEPKWRWEGVWIHQTKKAAHPHAGLSFGGKIINRIGDEFEITAELCRNVFLVWATQPRDADNKGSVHEFLSVFSWCDEKAGLMYGMWRDLDPEGRPTTYSTIWSRDQLTPLELQAISLHAVSTLGLGAVGDDGVEKHPQKHTLLSRTRPTNES